jgi:site-specific recombinase XerD
MYACGLRIGEAATLEIGTIDSDNGLLRIIGKGNEERLVGTDAFEPASAMEAPQEPALAVSHALRCRAPIKVRQQRQSG